ncbi:hypothetical protein IQ13_3066 [Lacibacter cauensis]|uniref:Uncharacterized protein n=2 Tax=Lacibacter cauensis TaxID=510947 RepID=A0A562SGF1_9BACT|nr:hypothetical protein IQ13_3066 [Lacibacter cauensis]
MGYYFLYTFQQKQLKREMKKEMLAGISFSELEVIDPSAAGTSFRWEEENKEFYLHDELYDIVEVRKEGTKTLYYCINDKKEKQLLKKLADAVRGGQQGRHGSKHGKQLVKFQLPVFVLSKLTVEFTGLVVERPSFGMLEQHLVSVSKEIKDPPPKA